MVNIFHLDNDLKRSARATFHCHVSRGILEGAVIFFTARELMGIKTRLKTYSAKHKYHAFHSWIATSIANYDFLYEFLYHLNNEHKARSGHDIDHNSFKLVDKVYKHDRKLIVEYFTGTNPTPMYIAMPNTFIAYDNNVIESYRIYYFFYKRFILPFISWGEFEEPHWYCYQYFYSKKYVPVDYMDFDILVIDLEKEKKYG